MLRVHCVLLSGGSGSRMGSDRPKQFLPLGDRPVLAHSFRTLVQAQGALSDGPAAFCAVAPHTYIEETRQVLQGDLSAIGASGPDLSIVAGGADRHESTLAGLRALLGQTADRPGTDLVLLHDAARPLIQAAEIERLVRALAPAESMTDASHADLAASVRVASLAGPLTETIVRASALPGPVEACVDRSQFCAIKTPQALGLDAARDLLARADGGEFAAGGFTDLLTWAAAAGRPAKLVEASPRNLKLTHPADLPWLASLLGDAGQA